MKTQLRSFRRPAFFVCVAVLAAFALSMPALGQNAATAQVPTISFQPERVVPGGAIVYRSGTMLVRTRDRVFATIHTSGLTPGTVVTGWFAFFNYPDECATRPCTAADFANPAVQGRVANFGGRIVGADGVADFAEDRAAGDTTNVFLGMGFGPGLIDPRRAEIHLVVRTHGAASANPATLTEQLTTFNGGCPPNVCANVQAAVHAP
jgi:hypothetical protein